MSSKYTLKLASFLFFFSAIPVALAQAPRGIFVTPIANEPFMAVVSVKRTRVQRDGTVLNLKSIHAIGRGSQGQIYNEFRPFLPATSNAEPPIMVSSSANRAGFRDSVRLGMFPADFPQDRTMQPKIESALAAIPQ